MNCKTNDLVSDENNTTGVSVISRTELELMVLKKVDPSMIQLIITAPLVAIYTYDFKRQKWNKTNYEGVLFLYKTKNVPRYHMLLLNRLNNKHFFQPISENLQLQFEESIIQYTEGNGIVFGLWFHEKQFCQKVAYEISKLIDANKENEVALKRDNANVDIIAMLQNAEQRYIQEMANKTPKVAKSDNCNIPSPNVMNFFLNAGKTCDNSFNSPVSNCNDSTEGIIKKLMDNPKYDIQNIEKQQRTY